MKIMKASKPVEINLDDGNYTVRLARVGLVEVRRDNSPWIRLDDDYLASAMLREIISLREEKGKPEEVEFPDSYGWWWCRRKGEEYHLDEELCVEVTPQDGGCAAVRYGPVTYHVYKDPEDRKRKGRHLFTDMWWVKAHIAPFARELGADLYV